MKNRDVRRTDRGRLRGLVHRGTRTDKSPPVSAEHAYTDPTVCDRCGAVYARKTWRRSGTREAVSFMPNAERATCPACRQVEEGRAYGRVVVHGQWLREHEDEVRRRLANVAARARHTQPERRLVKVVRRGDGLVVTTTSQKLAHRVVHELQKAFGGSASYSWSDRDGSLLATWLRD
jgi:NMD protein affecting ribosome stability and mRNA decay